MHKLATIQTISKIEAIEGADRIEKATVLGWHVVVKKGLYKEGDMVVYLEIDSVLPKELSERAEFTDKYLKPRRFKGVYSQGMCLPISELPEWLQKKGIKVGQDVTADLGITKFEADARNDEQWWKNHKTKVPNKWYMKFHLGRWLWKKYLYKPVAGLFPTNLVLKTDETRVQILGDVLKLHKGIVCQYTEKLDGSSITFWVDKKDTLHVCSRNRELFDKKDVMVETASKLKYKLMQGYYIYQGEILGPNIQGNKYGVKDYCIFVYQVYKPDEKEYMNLFNSVSTWLRERLSKFLFWASSDSRMTLTQSWICVYRHERVEQEVPHEGNRRRIFLHRLIMGLKDVSWKEQQVDHIDGNPLNNCRSNLRLATASENQINKKFTQNIEDENALVCDFCTLGRFY